MDDELLAANPRETYVSSVREEAAEYKKRGKKMIKAEVADTGDVDYRKLNGYEMAYVLTNYVTSEGNDYQTVYQKYALRKDNNGNWKILGFEKSDEDGL